MTFAIVTLTHLNVSYVIRTFSVLLQLECVAYNA